MHKRIVQQLTQEPIGIVIADGGRVSPTTKFSAFVWGPAPEEFSEVEPEQVLAAVA